MAKDNSDGESPDLSIPSWRGGMNDEDPPQAIEDDQVVLAKNVEFFDSTLGERRRGCEAVDTTGSGLDDEDHGVFLGTHVPEGAKISQSELWAASATYNLSVSFAHRVGATWFPVVPVDTPAPTAPEVHNIRSQSMHGKMYVAFKSDVDRLHLWDGTTFRRAGMGAPTAAPTAVNEGVGVFVDDRGYRVRYIEKDGDAIVRRGEPSDELTFTPSGTGAGATVTRPGLIGEGETDWELEASDGDGNWYAIATIPVATTTYNDETQPATDYANNGDLSGDIGDYTPIPSVRIIKADEDRLIFAGSWTDSKLDSRLSWTPVGAAVGAGNDERVPLDSNSFKDLDWQEGGPITDMSTPLSGSFYVFKWSRVYKAQRSGTRLNAYDVYLLHPANGAIPGSVVNGVDEYGRSCVYFIDPSRGPMRIGAAGLQPLKNLRGTWRHVNTAADLILAHGVYYSDREQVKLWVPIDNSRVPQLLLTLQADLVRSQADGTKRGWSIADGKISRAYASTTFPEAVINEVGATQLNFRPYITMGGADGFAILRCDIGNDDDGERYRAHILSKPYILTGLLNQWGAMEGALLASGNTDASVTLDIRFIRDFGREQSELVNTNFVPDGSEDPVIKYFDNLKMSEAKSIQLDIQDPP